MYQEVLDDRKGRCAVASVALQAGSCVLRTSAVCAVSVSSCGWCFTPQVALSRCTGCRVARYCSRKCQQLDWAQHRRECSVWRSVPAVKTSPTVLLVSRLAFKLFLGSGADQEEKNSVLKLRHHLEDHTTVKRQQFQEMAQLVLLLLSRYKGDKYLQIPSFETLRNDLEEEILKLFGRVNCNAFSLANDMTNEAVGIGLFPNGALFNHDCDPNCVVSFKGREMQVHVVKDVQEGQELTVSYIELLQSTTSRRSELKDSYFFDCECTRCQTATMDDWYFDGLMCSSKGCQGAFVESKRQCNLCGTERDTTEVARYEEELKSISSAQSSSELERWEKYQRMWTIATLRLRLHPRNAQVAVMAREIGNFLLTASSEQLQHLALPFCQAELRATEWLLPKTPLPSRGLLQFQIGKLLFEASASENGELLLEAAEYLQQALSVYVSVNLAGIRCELTVYLPCRLSCAYGRRSTVVQSAQLMLDDVHRSLQLL
ncbi:Histone-lysine N-methyltransferase SMYD3 [Phytophthora citrophthora]|uniref:Histone-lysine N-methyltransferase SMYD3 n=1 Tax=Phytophthora citrophthora TaxID=4793 RepID=A0AAD9GYA1_9STRA|nr:Histone-lysine N-methyltransferase SMYD3 [Phytophthora citrophthora]